MESLHHNIAAFRLLLKKCHGVGPQTLRRITASAPTYAAFLALAVPAQDLLGITPEIRQALLMPDWADVQTSLEWAQQSQQQLIFWDDAAYPPLLHEIASAPALLWVLGDVAALPRSGIAIVGTRNPSPGGHTTAAQFAEHLAEHGLTIISGLARGIDTAAHLGALAANGQTIAVLGSGLQQIYPRENRNLAANIVAQGGCIVSEYPLTSTPLPAHFPQRNRIISGLACGTLVVEASFKSGSLITARHASQQGREVFAIPGSLHNPVTQGCHHLIQQGAKLVTCVADITTEIKGLVEFVQSQTPPPNSVEVLAQTHQKLVKCVGYETTPFDILVERARISAPQLSKMLVDLELRGIIQRVPGGYIRM